MATPVIMPKLGQSVESCLITEWFKKPGDAVNEGDPLFSYETDKSSFTENAAVSGKLLAVFFEENEDVPCLLTVAVIGQDGEDVSAYAPTGKSETKKETEAPSELPQQQQRLTDVEGPALEMPIGTGKISPRARALAEKLKLDVSILRGSGPNGRIIEQDVLSFQRNGSALGGRYTAEELAALGQSAGSDDGYEDIKHSNMRKVIAKSMQASLSTMAQLTHNTSFDATQMNKMRASIKKGADKGVPQATINDMLLYVVSRVLKNHKEVNAHYFDDKMRCFKGVNLGIATDTPRGLLVPTLYGADKKSLWQISNEAKKLTGSARDGAISPDLLKNATFTITNLGSLGIESFTPIVNPPQVAILGVCALVDKVRMGPSSIIVYPAMGLSLTYDHRALDGAPASRFLKEVADTLANFIDFYKAQGDTEYELEL